jgi:regulator of RNase E activity RraA
MIMSDVPGEIGGVSVARGDMVFGDVDGIVIVPSSTINEVVEKSLEKVSKENIVRKEIRAGHALVDIFAKHKIL